MTSTPAEPKPAPTVYGIANCDNVKRARAWLLAHGVTHDFHDFKKSGVPPARLAAWVASAGWQGVLNRQGTTWRKLDAATQAAVLGAVQAQALMLAHPSTIKRPVVEWPKGSISVGFLDADFERHLNDNAPA